MRECKTSEFGSIHYRPRDLRRRLSVLILIVGGIWLLIILFSDWRGSAVAAEAGFEAASTFVIPDLAAESSQEGKDFSRFSHSNPTHQRLPCLLCHRREDNSPTPVRSVQHTPCAGCHSEQFQAKSGAMCTICHTNVESRGRELKPFPSLRSFNMTFNHAKHRNVDCSNCHKPFNRGVALSMPLGMQAHATCFRCHEPRAKANGQDISSCSKCHKPGRPSRASTAAKAFRVSFSHDQHRREGLTCAECHKITGRTADQVSSPLPSQHSGSRAQSCESCHNNTRAFGIGNFADCKRCHRGPTFRF